MIILLQLKANYLKLKEGRPSCGIELTSGEEEDP